jgi:hypothetical protein
MKRVIPAVAVMAIALLGCKSFVGFGRHHEIPQPTYSQYHLEGFAWENVGRVLVLPFLNESPHTRAGDEVHAAFTGELQRLGRFEVVAAPPDECAELSTFAHRAGRFDEGVMIDLGNKTRADVVIHGTITHYSPYPRPRLGLVLQAVGPKEAKVVASVDGLWDTTDRNMAERVRAYYRQKHHERPRLVLTHTIASDDSFAAELALDSPALFQRFVCHEAAMVLLDLPIPIEKHH